MSSSIFFKFRSSKEPQRVEFDGTHLTVFELKREIINVSGLGDGTDFDLHIYDESNPDQEYDDDTTLIPRSSSVVARRVPAPKPGHGRAARYVSGKAPVSGKNVSRSEQSKSAASVKKQPALDGLADMSKAMTEEERIAAYMAADSAQWEQQRQALANAKPVYYKNPANRKHLNSDKPLPPGYICHRCQEKGHWIQDCPTNNDPTFEPKPRLKRTTGIPKTFIKAAPKTNGANGTDGTTDDSQAGTVMLDAEGNQVVVVPDSESWKKFEQKHKAATAAQQEAASSSENKELEERGLLCPIDNRLFVDPMKTPCCGKTYCNDCIENTLLDTDLVCPNCGQPVLIDNLVSDDEMITKIREYERDKAEREKAARAERAVEKTSETATAEPAKKASTDSPKAASIKSPKSPDQPAVKSPSAQPSTAALEVKVEVPTGPAALSKKRPAPDDPDWANVPTGPAAMRKSQSQPQTTQMQPNMQAFPNQMQFPMFQPFAMSGPMPGAFAMPPFAMQPQMPFNNFYGPMGGMGNMDMMTMNMNMNANMNTNWQQMPFHGGQPQQPGHHQFNDNINSNFNPQQEDSAYLRQPVNPRNQHRAKRARPCDYTTLS